MMEVIKFISNNRKYNCCKKNSYETFYNLIGRNFHSAICSISVDEQTKIKEDLLSKNFCWEDSIAQLDS